MLVFFIFHLNVLMFCLFATMAVVVVAGGVVLFYRKYRTQPDEMSEYRFLAA